MACVFRLLGSRAEFNFTFPAVSSFPHMASMGQFQATGVTHLCHLLPGSCFPLRWLDWVCLDKSRRFERTSTAVVWAFLKGCASSRTTSPLALWNTGRVFSSSVFVEITHFRLSWLGFLLLNIFSIVIWLKSWQEYLNWDVPLLLLYILILIAEGLGISEGHLRLS